MLHEALRDLPRPPETAARPLKKAYGERLSNAIAAVMAADLRAHGMATCLPEEGRGKERRLAGGIGAKKVDVSWSTEEAGLIFAASIKTINFRDSASGAYQKNLTNRRGDMLYEAVTLHKRFPYATLAGFMFLHHDAATDDVGRSRQSTFANAHHRLRIFSGRHSIADPPEQFEHGFIGLYNAESMEIGLYAVGNPNDVVPWQRAREQILETVALRNPDHFIVQDQELRKC